MARKNSTQILLLRGLGYEASIRQVAH